MKSNKILVPIDFSKNSLNALDYALQIAEKTKSDVLVAHLYQTVLVNADLTKDRLTFDIHETKEVAEEKLGKLLKNAQKKCPDVKIDLVIEGSKGIKSLIQIANKENINLIVMGTRGAGSVESVLFGSFTAETIEKANCPVLAIPENAKFSDFSKIAYATEFNFNDISNLIILTELFKAFNPVTTIIHCSNKPEYSIPKMQLFESEIGKRQKEHKFKFEIINNDNIYDGINEFVQKNETKLLVMSTRKRAFFEKLVDRSSTKKMAYATKTPLLAFHTK